MNLLIAMILAEMLDGPRDDRAPADQSGKGKGNGNGKPPRPDVAEE